MLNKATSVAENLLNATVDEINTALGNARNRLSGKPNATAAAVASAQDVEDEADDITLASLRLHLAVDSNTDPAKAKAALAILTPAAPAVPASGGQSAATPPPASSK
jgi:hypothetical protein